MKAIILVCHLIFLSGCAHVLIALKTAEEVAEVAEVALQAEEKVVDDIYGVEYDCKKEQFGK